MLFSIIVAKFLNAIRLRCKCGNKVRVYSKIFILLWRHSNV